MLGKNIKGTTYNRVLRQCEDSLQEIVNNLCHICVNVQEDKIISVVQIRYKSYHKAFQIMTLRLYLSTCNAINNDQLSIP
jgi:hypothetical protein